MVNIGLNYKTDAFGGALTLQGNWSYKGDIVQFETPAPVIDQEAYDLLNASMRLEQLRRSLDPRRPRQEPDRRGRQDRRLLLRLGRLPVDAGPRGQHDDLLRSAADAERDRRIPDFVR
ncbi:MAG: hypothetical protein U5O39_16230 [Gammaproteobacteria bacterium]|nr:hypothetical protein [Gammaproteobacteria bacterium]